MSQVNIEEIKAQKIAQAKEVEAIKAKIEAHEAEIKELKAKLKVMGATKERVNKGVKDFVQPLIEEGLSNKEILELVHQHYGNDNTTYSCIAWYRNNLKK